MFFLWQIKCSLRKTLTPKNRSNHATINILNMQRVLHHVRDAVVSGYTFDVPLNNHEHIDGIMA